MEKRADLERGAKALFDMIVGGKIDIEVSQSLPITAVAQAHDSVESGSTTGATVLTL
ncbi:MAG: NADPH2:quinone reductase [Pseudohongiellaceae bacterium]